MKKYTALLLHYLFYGLCTVTSIPAFAANIPQNNALDSIVSRFASQTTTWEPIIHNLTLSLFWGLATISFTWSFIQLELKEGTGLVDVLAELTRRTLLIGFSIWMMNEAPNLARYLINSFVYVGTTISGGKVNFSPSNIFELGTNIMTIAWDGASIAHPGDTLALFLCALIILVCFALMAMEMTILIVSGYIIVSGGIIAMGFLGSEWTRDNAMNYFTAVLGVAFKMFIMQLIFIVGYSFIQDWGTSITTNSESIEYLILIGSCIVFAGMMREIPQMAASLASGRFTMQGGGIQAAGTAIAAGVAGAALLAGGMGMTAYQGLKGGSSDNDDSASSSGSSSTSPGAHTMDTGPGDDGAGYAAKMQNSRAGAPEGASSSSPSAGPGAAPNGPPGRSRTERAMSVAKSAAKTSGKLTGAALHAVATRSAFGNMLAKGAKILGEQPVDPSTASAEDLNRQLTAALNPTKPNNSNSAAFDNNITSAENQHVYDEEEARQERHHDHES